MGPTTKIRDLLNPHGRSMRTLGTNSMKDAVVDGLTELIPQTGNFNAHGLFKANMYQP